MILCVEPLSADAGFIPSPFHVHWPNSAFPSKANLEVPHPVSFAAWAIAKDTGIVSILIFKVVKSRLTTPYCLNFFFNQFFSDFVLLFLFKITNKIFLSNLIILFSSKISGKTICINNSFLFLVLSIDLISLGKRSIDTGFTILFFLTSFKLYFVSLNNCSSVAALNLTVSLGTTSKSKIS